MRDWDIVGSNLELDHDHGMVYKAVKWPKASTTRSDAWATPKRLKRAYF